MPAPSESESGPPGRSGSGAPSEPAGDAIPGVPTDLPLSVDVERTFDASPDRVFDAWLEPGLIGEWMFGPPLRDEEVQGISVAPRVGGSFSFRVLRDGKSLDHAGRYLELERPRRLAFTWGVRQYLPESSRVDLSFEPSGSGTRLTLSHRMPADAAPYADQTRKGWGAMLDVLADVLRSESSTT